MNFVGHVRVAQLVAERSGLTMGHEARLRYLVGAALPDWSAMGRFRLAREPADEAMRSGVALHHRTDDAFHRHRWFLDRAATAATRMEARGLGRGAARACGHVGVELLLDGRLLADHPPLGPEIDRALAEVADPVLGVGELVAPAHGSAWRQHLDRLSGWSVPDDYREPGAVARRLWRILARRPRLAFAEAEISLVSGVLDHLQPELDATSTELLTDLTTELSE